MGWSAQLSSCLLKLSDFVIVVIAIYRPYFIKKKCMNQTIFFVVVVHELVAHKVASS